LKSKKLFAILTLVMFMMTLVPMAAFAADYSAAASEVKPTSASVDIYEDDTDLAKITVTFKGTNGKALPVNSPVDFVVKSDRDAEVGYVLGNGDDPYDRELLATGADGAAMSTPTGQQFTDVPVDANGKVYIYVGSSISGTFKISVYTAAGAEDGLLLGSVNVTASVGEGKVELYATNEDYDADTSNMNGEQAATNVAENFWVTAGDGVNLKAVVEDGGTAIEGKTVIFQAKFNEGSWYTIATETTDEDGEAEYYFEQTKAGKYQYRASIGDDADDKSYVIDIEVKAGVTKSIEPITADGKKVAKSQSNSIDFYVKDKYGNLVKNFATSDYQVKFESAPAGSKFEDIDWTTSGPSDAGITLGTDDSLMKDGKLRISFKPDKVGAYTIKVRDINETRVTATINVEAVEFGKAVSLKFVLKNVASPAETVTSLVRVYDAADSELDRPVDINKKAGTLQVYAVNAAGVEVQKTDEITMSSSDTGKVTVSNAGEIVIKKDAAGAYPITVYYAPDNLVAVYDLNVVGSASSFAVTPVVNGKNATVTIQYVDKNGANTFTNLASEGFTVSAPSGVIATNQVDINKSGKGTFELTANEYGKYSVTVISSEKRVAKTFEIEFVMPASEKPVIGARNVTMFIGATGYVQDGAAKVMDVAPFIQDSRTFVAVRYIADAFGSEVGWNEATQTVTLSRADMTVTIVIGSNVITVVQDGVTSTVTADVAAFIKDGRTVLPFRAVGDAFGATVSYDAATQAVSYAQ